MSICERCKVMFSDKMRNNFRCKECLNGDLRSEVDVNEMNTVAISMNSDTDLIYADNSVSLSSDSIVFNYGVNETSAMYYSDDEALEDRKNFVRNLGILASQTRDQVVSMELDVDTENNQEHVIITYKGGFQKSVNVKLNSYSAIVRDVFKYI